MAHIPGEELIDLSVVVVVVPDAEEALDVVHHGHAEHGRVHVGVTPDRHVGQGLDGAVLAVELSGIQCVFKLFCEC